jgi:4-oxalocrotonate tautomerase family enzyme
MPFIILYIEEGKTEDQKRRVTKDITLGISENFHIPEQAIRIIFQEPREDQLSYRGWLRSDPEFKAQRAEIESKPYTRVTMPFVILYTEVGKTDEQFQRAARDITIAISKHFDIPEAGVQIIFQEVNENRVASGGLLYSNPEYKAQLKLMEHYAKHQAA